MTALVLATLLSGASLEAMTREHLVAERVRLDAARPSLIAPIALSAAGMPLGLFGTFAIVWSSLMANIPYDGLPVQGLNPMQRVGVIGVSVGVVALAAGLALSISGGWKFALRTLHLEERAAIDARIAALPAP